jgi:hypothetical protein
MTWEGAKNYIGKNGRFRGVRIHLWLELGKPGAGAVPLRLSLSEASIPQNHINVYSRRFVRVNLFLVGQSRAFC